MKLDGRMDAKSTTSEKDRKGCGVEALHPFAHLYLEAYLSVNKKINR